MVQAIQVLRFHLLELEKVSIITELHEKHTPSDTSKTLIKSCISAVPAWSQSKEIRFPCCSLFSRPPSTNIPNEKTGNEPALLFGFFNKSTNKGSGEIYGKCVASIRLLVSGERVGEPMGEGGDWMQETNGNWPPAPFHYLGGLAGLQPVGKHHNPMRAGLAAPRTLPISVYHLRPHPCLQAHFKAY